MLTHLDAQGRANMVDVSDKQPTTREAVAEARVRMLPSTLQMIVAGGHPKGDVFAVARIAGIQAAKKTADLIPLCHSLMLSSANVELQAEGDDCVRIQARCKLTGQTGVEMEALTAASFVGYVRDYNEAHAVRGLFLEHYPGMTEKALAAIEAEARARWPLFAVEIVHRVGQLLANQPIVFVGVSSAHRQAAFEACAFIMDYLKTRAPFWKKEHDGQTQQWVEARASDQHAAQRWGSLMAD